MTNTEPQRFLIERERKNLYYAEAEGVKGWHNLQRTSSTDEAAAALGLDVGVCLWRWGRLVGLTPEPAAVRLVLA